MSELKAVMVIGGNAPSRDATLKIYPTGGPSGMRYAAYYEPGYSPCEAPGCPYCRNLIQGFGVTEEEAIADYWEQWADREHARLDAVRLDEMDKQAGCFEPEGENE